MKKKISASIEAKYKKAVGIINSADSTKEEFQESIRLFQECIDAGHSDSALAIAEICIMYKDYENANKYYIIGATMGNKACLSNLAFSKFHGQGIDKDEKEAFRLWNEAVKDCDDPRVLQDACYQIGCCYLNCTGGIKKINAKEAMKWHLIAADNGNTTAQFNVGTAYIIGDALKQDIAKGFKYLEMAKAGGSKRAQEAIDYFGEKYPNRK